MTLVLILTIQVWFKDVILCRFVLGFVSLSLVYGILIILLTIFFLVEHVY